MGQRGRADVELPADVRVEEDADELRVFVVRDLLHLDADAMHDRLAHWSRSELARRVPAAEARLSFRHASPADPLEESTLDLQEGWLGLEPTLALELARARPGDRERLLALVPRFLELVEGEGRPAGYRSPDVGSLE